MSDIVKKNLKNYLKMKDLKEKTGLPSSTINYYLRNGLLPEPVRTGKNMAWYHPSTISRLNLIKKLQEKNRLTISEIFETINRFKNNDDIYVIDTLYDFIFSESKSKDLYTKDQLVSKTGLKLNDIDKLIELKIIIPEKKDLFDDHDLFIAKAVKKGLDMGLSVEAFEYYAKAAEEVSINEMKMREKLTSGLPLEKNAELTSELTDMARQFRAYIFERAFREKIIKTNSNYSA